MRQAIRIAKSEAKTILMNRMKTLAIIGIILMPLVYGFLYLWAFWDPYGNTQHIEIAVVNDDLGDMYDGSYRNIGKEIIGNLSSNDNVTWVFTDKYDAEQYFWSGRYAAIMTFPKGLTSDVLSIQDEYPVKPQIYLQTRDSNGYILARISKTVSEELEKNINDNITKTFIDELIDKKDELSENMTEAAEGAEDINNAIIQAAYGSGKIEDGTDDLSEGSETISYNYAKLTDGTRQIAAANKNLYLLSQGILSEYSAVTSGITADPATMTRLAVLKQKIAILSASEGSVYDSSLTLSNGMSTLGTSSEDAIEGIDDLEKGSNRITGGLRTASEASEELARELRKSSDKLDEYDETRLRTALEIFRNPVEIVDISDKKADNYGTGLAPYFIQLALWIGCLLTLMFIGTKENRLIISKHSTFSITIGKMIVPAVIAAIQAVILDTAVIAILGLKVSSIPLFIATTILLSWTFLAIVQLLFFIFGKIGSIASIIVLMLQLTSASGTFPVSTSHPFFQAIAPFLPMTYGMTALREVILDPIPAHLVMFTLVMMIFISLGMLTRFLLTRRKLSLNDLRPRIQI